MPLPVINDVFLARLNWHNPNAPRDASNNLYFLDTTGSQSEINLNTDLNACVTQAMWGVVSGDAVVNALTIWDLSSTSAGVVFTQSAAAKWTGFSSSDCGLQEAAVVSVKSTTRGPAGRGRIYLPWVGESSQTNGTLTGTGYTNMQAAWTTFETAMATAGWETVQVSQAGGVDVANNAHYTVRPNVYTQRRRARR